ncbi:hypothetical protein [Flavobacterium sp.]|uniref:hypothetical protein n=1 Tax=Flavobacterium sp. TaxID=239 RepID=UPI00262699DE|nr:hypothetical protein [Flavobacterium sp.]MDD3004622.1 hypothetical protein [Flavobacterium sp.]
MEHLPIYKKAMSICKLVESFMSTLPEDDIFLQQSKGLMMEDAIAIPSKIAGAEGGNLYSIKMQNAALIRNHAMHLYTQLGSFRFHSKFKEQEYVTLLRKELDEFKALFVEWIADFDTEIYIWDDWGLFNPPGAIEPNDLDDDFFDINDFSEESD